jgi:hypothetical protein
LSPDHSLSAAIAREQAAKGTAPETQLPEEVSPVEQSLAETFSGEQVRDEVVLGKQGRQAMGVEEKMGKRTGPKDQMQNEKVRGKRMATVLDQRRIAWEQTVNESASLNQAGKETVG